jgi:serine/threonine protein kinase
MGVVYKARHRGLRRSAALKMVLAGQFASPSQELRFRLEAERGARVHHPNIVQVYEIGDYEGRPFLALEWVEGGSLANRLGNQPWPPSEAAALIETLARAMDVAHGEGVVHRDLKPADILMAVTGGATPPPQNRRSWPRTAARRRPDDDAERLFGRHAGIHGPSRPAANAHSWGRRRTFLCGAWPSPPTKPGW